MPKHKYLLLAGHGGEVFGEYLTAGKRSPEVPPGIYEGVFNREICGLVVPALRGSGIEAEFLNPGPYNIPTTVRSYERQGKKSYGLGFVTTKTRYPRVEFVNDIHRRTQNQCILLVVHCNAARGTGWSDANGYTVFHSRNASMTSRDFAMSVYGGMSVETQTYGRGVLEKNFSILSKTKCPAVLLEMFFMTNPNDTAYATSDQGKADLVHAIHYAVLDLEKEER